MTPPIFDAVDACVDWIIDDSPLARGVVNKARRSELADWSAWAHQRWVDTGDPDFERFNAGLGMTVALFAAHHQDADDVRSLITTFLAFGAVDGRAVVAALNTLGKKRSSRDDREQWSTVIRQAPSDAAWRGMLAAAVVLAGGETQWGLTRTDAVIDNPADRHTSTA